MRLLSRISRLCNDQHKDRGVRLDYLQGVTLDDRGASTRIVAGDGDKQSSEDLAYDLNTLHEQELIDIWQVNTTLDRYGQIETADGEVRMTMEGLAAVADFRRSWWSKAIDKQPITFVQVCLAIIQIVFTVGSVVWAWAITQSVWYPKQNPKPPAPAVQSQGRTRQSAGEPMEPNFDDVRRAD
jgi:hypothetical protein